MQAIETPSALGEELKKARKSQGLKLTETALLSNISTPVLCKLEGGLKKGDVDAYTSLFRLLPQIGVYAYLETPEGEKVKVHSARDIAKTVVLSRKRSHFYQGDLASLVGVSTPSINKLESPAKKERPNGDTRLRLLMKVFDALGIKLFLDTGR